MFDLVKVDPILCDFVFQLIQTVRTARSSEVYLKYLPKCFLKGISRTGTEICKKLMHNERKYINKKQKFMTRFILFILVSNNGRAGVQG